MFWPCFSSVRVCSCGEKNLRIRRKTKPLAAGLAVIGCWLIFAASPETRAAWAESRTTVESADVCIALPALDPCRACHALTPGTPSSRTGPNLIGIFNAPAVHRGDFRYSRILQQAREKELVWTTENLDAYLENPARFLNDKTENRGNYKMLYQIRDEKTRGTIIEALRVLSLCLE